MIEKDSHAPNPTSSLMVKLWGGNVALWTVSTSNLLIEKEKNTLNFLPTLWLYSRLRGGGGRKLFGFWSWKGGGGQAIIEIGKIYRRPRFYCLHCSVPNLKGNDWRKNLIPVEFCNWKNTHKMLMTFEIKLDIWCS